MLFAGCASAPTTAETGREVVLQYVGTDVGTAGPFSKKSNSELAILSDKDRVTASSLLDHGAVAFLVYSKGANASAVSTPGKAAGTRVILLQHGRVVGDFKAP
jgi:hypothetical protein